MADFDLVPTSYTITDYCRAYKKKEIKVNRDYQRSDKVWPPAARSFLIETILLGYPIPKLSLYQVTDVKTKETVKEIVDGQQRTRAILDFYNGELRLGRSIELKDLVGNTYDDLDEALQHQFLNYPLSVDLFTGARPDEIREVFRRINSYTVPLNPEEHRHAVWQGEMKWFIYELSKKYEQVMIDIGAFRASGIVRMADAKLYADVIYALLHGFATTKSPQLNRLYREKNDSFEEQEEIAQRFSEAMDIVLSLEDVHDGPLMKPHMLYTLLLAIMHVRNPVEELQGTYRVDLPIEMDLPAATARLTELAESLALEEPGERDFREFIAASRTGTNVGAKRETRFAWVCDALSAKP